MQIVSAMIKVIVLSMWLVGQAFAASPLPADQAFQVSAEMISDQEVVVHFKMAPDYFIYQDKIRFTLNPNINFNVKFPPTVSKEDPVRGVVSVYGGDVAVPLALSSKSAALGLTIYYQGCSLSGFCYPPTHKTISLGAAGNSVGNTIVTTHGISALLTDQYGVQNLLAYEHRGWLLLIFIGLGILMAFTPCVLPMLPIVTAIIAGQKHNVSARKAFSLSFCYVLGMAITYAMAGMLAAYAGGSIQVWLETPAVIIVSSLIFVLLAFSLFEFYELPISRRWQNAVTRWSNSHEGGTYVGVFFMGVLSTLVISPCVTAPLVGVLLYIGRTGDIALGGASLFVMGLGMGIPLILLAMSAGHWLPKSGVWMQAVTKSFGMVMFGMAIWLLGRILPQTVMMVLWGAYLVAWALFFSLYLTRTIGKRPLNHTIGFSLGLFGILMIMSTAGVPSLVQRWMSNGSEAAVLASNFMVVQSEDELLDALEEAKAAGDPVLVDFYADWCSSCVVMEKEVFAKASVQAILKPFKLIRVDLSQNTDADHELLKAYHVIAPPTVIFFSAAGEEVNTRRIVGEISAADFLNRINLFMAQNCDIKAQC